MAESKEVLLTSQQPVTGVEGRLGRGSHWPNLSSKTVKDSNELYKPSGEKKSMKTTPVIHRFIQIGNERDQGLADKCRRNTEIGKTMILSPSQYSLYTVTIYSLYFIAWMLNLGEKF